MATATTRVEDALIVEVGKRHPEYSIILSEPPNEIYPYLLVRNEKSIVHTQIRLDKQQWSVAILDRIAKSAIRNIKRYETR